MWRIRSLHPNETIIARKDLKMSIMHEIGTDPRTWYQNLRSLKALGWIKTHGPHYVRLTGNDLTGDA